MNDIVETVVIPMDHPALPGHFPGQPIIPGAVLIDHIVALAETRGGWLVEAVVTTKFHKMAQPGFPIVIRLTPSSEITVAFTCTIDNISVASGRLRVASLASRQ